MIGGTAPTNSGDLRIRDSGSLTFASIDVNEALFNVDTRIGTNYGLTLQGTAVQSAPSGSSVVLYTDLSGGKVRLMARFPSGTAFQVAIEP